MDAARRLVAGGSLLLLSLGLACSGGDERLKQTAGETPTTLATTAARRELTQPEPATTPTATTTLAATPRATPTPDIGMVLPDLQTTASDDVYITVTGTGVRLLHFATEVHNTGAGPMQIVSNDADAESSPDGTAAWQVIETRVAGSIERGVGRLQMSDEHLHWHLDNFATYELWTLTPEGDLQTLVASSGKVTFCLVDEFPLDPPNPEVPIPVFGPCDPYAQGISPGWGETYEAWLPGQMLDITGLADGTYALRTVLDPDNMLLESDKTNNVYVMRLVIEGNEVTPAAELAEEAPQDGAGDGPAL